MKKKTTVKATGPDAIKARIMGLDMKSFLKLGVGEFALLRERADFDGQKKLDYLSRLHAATMKTWKKVSSPKHREISNPKRK